MSIIFVDKEVFKHNSVDSMMDLLHLAFFKRNTHMYNHYELRQIIIDTLNELSDCEKREYKLMIL